MGATYKLKRKLADGTLEDVVLQGAGGGGGVPFISSSNITVTTGTGVIAQKWAVADVGGITTATDGMTVAVRMPTGGSSYGVNLSIDGGNTYYPIVQNVNTSIRMIYSQGSTLILTFNASQTVRAYMTGSGMTQVTGCWQTTDIDTNNQVSQCHTTTDDKFPLIFKYSSGVTSTSTQQAMARYANNIYVNPSTGTVYANDFVANGQSIVGGYSPFTTEESNYSLVVGEEIDLEVYATDGMPQHIEIYVYQDVGNDQPLNLQLYNQAGDTIDIPYTYGGEYSIIVKPNASNFDIYIRRANGGMTYLGSMCMEYIYLNSPSALDGVSHDTEITVKYCWLNTIV